MAIPDETFNNARLVALDRYQILDTAPEAGFQDIVNLAAHICDAPIALVSLVASDRQWFKAKVGLEACETDLNSSVCAHGLIGPDILIIPDLAADPRTRENPLVEGEPRIRFYAGAPLRTPDGHAIGSLCVIDVEPRPSGLSKLQADMLQALARQVMSELELRRLVLERDGVIARQVASEKVRAETERDFRHLFDSIDDGFCIIEMRFDGDKPVDYRFVETNPAFAKQTGLADAQGKWMRDLAPEHEQHWFDLYGRVATTREPVRFENAANKLDNRWYEVQAFPVGEATANHVGILFRDVSSRKTKEIVRQSTEALQNAVNHELNHRMKNIFAMVQAIATQTLRSAEDRELISSFTSRLHALSAAQDVLLTQNRSGAELSELARAVLQTAAPLDRFEIDGPIINLGANTTLAATLVIHELCTNALKYGSLSNDTGRVHLHWSVIDDEKEPVLKMTWREIGGPRVEPSDRKGFGSRLISRGLCGSGGCDLRFRETGLEAVFTAPLEQVQAN